MSMTSSWVTSARNISFMLLAPASVSCAPTDEDDSTATLESAATALDPVPCAAWADTVVANTSNISLGAGSLVDS